MVYTVDMFNTVDMVYTVYTIQTALHCLNSSMYAYIYIDREGRTLLKWVDKLLSKMLNRVGEWIGLDTP